MTSCHHSNEQGTPYHSEILQYLGLHLSSTLAVLPNLMVHTFFAPALRTMSTIWDIVVPRTIESSTNNTLRPENTAGMAFSLRLTLSSLVLCGALSALSETDASCVGVLWMPACGRTASQEEQQMRRSN